jgi:hypothetical protein
MGGAAVCSKKKGEPEDKSNRYQESHVNKNQEEIM